MKKHLVLGALAVLSLAACTKSEVVELNKGNEISLTAVTGKNLTKAADGYCNKKLPNDFQVWASTTSGKKVYFQNETYTNYSGTYKSTTAHYWPAENLDFFALKNQNGTVAFDATTPKITVTGYTVESTPATQKDFLYAVKKGVSKPEGGKTNLNFRHALSQIEFKAKNLNKNIHVEIDGVQVVNVKNTGDFEATKATDTNFQNHIHDDNANADNRDDSRCSWANQGGKATYAASFAKTTVTYNTSVSLTSDDASGEYNSNTMYLLPQSITPWDPSNPSDKIKASESNNAYFIVNAIIYNVSGASFDPANDVVLWGDNSSGSWKTKPIAVQLPTGMVWQDGLRYVYTFNFTSYGTGGVDPGTGKPVLTPIELTVTVDDFVDAGNTDVEVK